MAKSMKDNKAIRMLKAAEEGGYGVIGVVSVYLTFLPFFSVDSGF
jgi:fructose-bisphosphate aldolase, class II